MAQVKIYGLKSHIDGNQQSFSKIIHECSMEVLGIPPDKKFHRYICMDKADFLFPDSRSERYIIIEYDLITGRTKETKKNLVKSLFKQLNEFCDIPISDIEIKISESPAENWGFRGMNGDEVKLSYDVQK